MHKPNINTDVIDLMIEWYFLIFRFSRLQNTMIKAITRGANTTTIAVMGNENRI